MVKSGREANPALCEEQTLHPSLASQLARLTLTPEGAPDADSWERLIDWVNHHYWEYDRLSQSHIDGIRGWSSFENLFRNSPIPIMEQDYTEVEHWMDDLRGKGVRSLREHLGSDIEAIRAVVPMIRIVAANPAAVRAVGLPMDELIGPIDPGIVNEGSEEGWLGQLEAVWNGDPVAHSAISAATADGRVYDAESILAAPLVDGEPDFSRAVFTLIDITVHRNEERRMQELVDAKNGFLAAVSHEVRTPLTAILGFARVLDDEKDLTDDDRQLMIHSVVQHAEEVADLVEDLLVVARAETGQIEVAETMVDLVAEVRRILQAGGSFTTDIAVERDRHLPQALGDPARVRQILRNLLTNAERYGGPEVSISVTVDDHDMLCVDVADNGPGLSPTEWERIFQPYQTAHDRPGLPGSVGIGLTVSRQLAELMGGTLRYRRDSRGSVFTLRLRTAGA